MKFSNLILKNAEYKSYIEQNCKADSGRKLCSHNLQHAIDVARVAYIISLENGYGIEKDIVYCAALLHDVAKWMQIQNKELDHAGEGALLAEKILVEIGMDVKVTAAIKDAIIKHRFKDAGASNLARVLYDADKSCRLCQQCENIENCPDFADGQQFALKY